MCSLCNICKSYFMVQHNACTASLSTHPFKLINTQCLGNVSVTPQIIQQEFCCKYMTYRHPIVGESQVVYENPPKKTWNRKAS